MLPEEVVLRGPNAKDLTFTILCWWLSMLRSIDPWFACARISSSLWEGLLDESGWVCLGFHTKVPRWDSLLIRSQTNECDSEARRPTAQQREQTNGSIHLKDFLVWWSVGGWERLWVQFHGSESWGEYWCLCKGADNIMGSCPQIAENLDFFWYVLHFLTVCLAWLTLLFDNDSAFHQSLAQAEGLIWIDAVLLLYLVLLCFTVISSLQSSRCIRAQERSFGIGNAIHCFVPKSTRFIIGTSEGFSTKVG